MDRDRCQTEETTEIPSAILNGLMGSIIIVTQWKCLQKQEKLFKDDETPFVCAAPPQRCHSKYLVFLWDNF